MPPANAPLYSHPLSDIEAWLSAQGCQRDRQNISQWTLSRDDWSAKLYLDVDSIVVRYSTPRGESVQRSFKYSLSRSDLEKVIFLGP
ncbi:DUF3143 domain-containing protein [soil metagenome]|uniref:DUF3143 domain-containing protein n=1 Tax=Leptolyngbya sp. BC1307 TaxID=2029589 RepID=UPI000EFC1FDB|nr:DUF3143 domain-containing protein [Leptolyngbya sp. BC1307]